LALWVKIKSGEPVLIDKPPHRRVIIPGPQKDQAIVGDLLFAGVAKAAEARAGLRNQVAEGVIALQQGDLGAGVAEMADSAQAVRVLVGPGGVLLLGQAGQVTAGLLIGGFDDDVGQAAGYIRT